MRDTPMTKARWQMLCLMADKKSGMTTTAIAKRLDLPRNTVILRLGRMQKAGLVVRVGGGAIARWCIPEHQATTAKYIEDKRTASNRRKYEWRQNQVTQRIVPAASVRVGKIPAVNSVWSLAA